MSDEAAEFAERYERWKAGWLARMGTTTLADDLGLYRDRCPRRGDTVSVPVSALRVGRGAGIRAEYTCQGCGHQWFTGWAVKAADPGLEYDDEGAFL